MTPLDATYDFLPSRALSDAEYGWLKEIPGVKVGRRRGELRVTAPYNVAWLVSNGLQQCDPLLRVEAPGLAPVEAWADTSEARMRTLLEASPHVHSWLATGVNGPFRALPFQLEAVHFGMQRNGMLLDESPGAGKTLQATLFGALGPDGPVLVLTKNAVTEQFRRAIGQFCPTEAIELFTSSKQNVVGGERQTAADALKRYLEDGSILFRGKARRVREEGSRPWVVVGWGALRYLLDELLAVEWATVIFDECHLAKAHKRLEWTNHASGLDWAYLDNLSCAAWRLAQAIPRRCAMTATVIPDRRRDLYGQLTLVEPNGWGFTGTAFLKRYCDAKPGEHGGLDTRGESNTEELQARMSFIYHKVPKAISHAQLPPLRLYTHFVPPLKQDSTSGFAREISKAAREAGKGGTDAKMRLRELQLMEAAARKRSVTLELVDEHVGGRESTGKVILFTGRLADCHDLGERVAKTFPTTKVWCSVGVHEREQTTKAGKVQIKRDYFLLDKAARVEMQDAYMAHPGPCVLVATAQAWGTGLDLHDTDVLYLVMLPYSPGEFVQYLGRVHRLGMKRNTAVVVLVAEGTVDEKVSTILAEKVPDIMALTGREELTDTADVLMGLDDIEGRLDSIVEKLTHTPVELDESVWGGL